jgi:hypothetical protein
MRWQNPWAWLGLLTLVLPILIHLFSRRRARVEPFPSLRFLDVSRLLPTRRTQLSDLALLLIRLGVLAAAVAALAQPLLRADQRAGAVDESLARVVVLDTSALADTAMADAAMAGDNEARAPDATLVLSTNRPAMALPGAVEWLRTRPGRGEILVVSQFAYGTLDSVDIAGIPADFGLSLRRVPSGPRDTTARDIAARDPGMGLRWDTRAAVDIANAVRSAVRAQGATALLAPPLDRAARVVVASPDVDSLREWISSARVLSEPWMGAVVFDVRGDSTLALASPFAGSVTDTTVAAPFVVVRRMSNGTPLVIAASIPGAGDGETARLLLLSRAPAEHLATATLLLAVSHSLAPAGASAAVDDVGRVDDEQLRRWERAPSARSTPSTADTSTDSGPSDGRWVWLLVLALLAVETIVRRASSREGGEAPTGTSDAAPRGTA